MERDLSIPPPPTFSTSDSGHMLLENLSSRGGLQTLFGLEKQHRKADYLLRGEEGGGGVKHVAH